MSADIRLEHRLDGFVLDLHVQLAKGGVTALFGPSGAGKTTVINAVAGLLRPDRGRVEVNGQVVLDTDNNVFVPPPKRRFGYVFQDARLFPHLSVRSNLLFGWKRAARRLPKTDVDHTIKLLGLGSLLDRRPNQLSGGERQRVSLGRALLANPTLLLLDEPLSGVDATRKHEILPFLERLRDDAGVPMIYVSHALDEVSRLADEVVVIEHGRISAHGSVHEIFSRADVGVISDSADAGAVIETTVTAQYPETHLSELTFERNRLLVPQVPLAIRAIGTQTRVHIRALDVTLALDEPSNISANNVWPAHVVGIHPREGAHADIQLSCGSATLLARITRYSVERLGLSEGVPVFAIIKSVTVDRGGSELPPKWLGPGC